MHWRFIKLTSGTLTNVSGVGDVTIAFSAWSNESLNPFWNNSGSRLDFQAWMTQQGYSGNIDFVLILLGINGLYSTTELSQSEIDTIIDQAKDLIDGVLNATYGYPSAEILLAMPPISANTWDGFGVNYGSNNAMRNYFLNMRLFWETLFTEFDDGGYHANVYLSSAGLWVDRDYGYPKSNEDISDRESTQYSAHTNHVHPTTSGYYQIADAFYSHIRGLL